MANNEAFGDMLARHPGVTPSVSLLIKSRSGQQTEAMRQVRAYLSAQFGLSVDLQIVSLRDFARVFGDIQAREIFLYRFTWAIGMALLVAILNISGNAYMLLIQRRFSIGVKRSVGASRSAIVMEIIIQMGRYGGVAGLAGAALAALLAPLVGASLNRCSLSFWCSAAVPVRAGLLTVLAGVGMGGTLWCLGALVPAYLFLRRSPSALLNGLGITLGRGWRFYLAGSLGLATGIATLIILLNIREGTLAQIDRILGWSGGERSGSFVSWWTNDTAFGDTPTILTNADYKTLRAQFPNVLVGWLGGKGNQADISILEASANMSLLHPPVLAAGRWLTPDEEKDQAFVTVLGPELARQLAGERGITVADLVGQGWRGRIIVGVMDEWSGLRAMGYYPDVAYVPIESYLKDGAARELVGLVGQCPFIIPDGLDFQVTIGQMRAALRSQQPNSEPQVVLPAKQLAELLAWRERLYLTMGLFAGFCLLIGGLGMMNSIFIWVVSRWREIGIRRAIGAMRWNVTRQVLTSAARMTLLAAIEGSAVGILVSVLVQSLQGWPLAVQPFWLFVAFVVAFMAATLFGGIPALWATTRSPVEMLRME
jgi:putative ABC transport system permease protein